MRPLQRKTIIENESAASPFQTTTPAEPNAPRKSKFYNAEFRFSDQCSTYYCTKIIDVKDTVVQLHFPDNIWEAKTVKAELVREAPAKNETAPAFAPALGKRVEWRTESSSTIPEHWKIGHVSQIPCETNDWKYEIVQSGDEKETHLVPPSSIRPVSEECALKLKSIKRVAVTVPQSLKSWAISREAEPYFDEVVEKTRVLAIVMVVKDGTDGNALHKSKATELVLVGYQDTVQKGAELLLHIIKSQKGVLTSNERRGRRLKFLEERRSKHEDCVQCEFVTDDALLGMIIGKQGEKLNGVAKQHKVEIRVLPADGAHRCIRIYGSTVESVEESRAALEYVYFELPVDPSISGWLTGNKGGNIKEIFQMSEVQLAWYDETKGCLVLFGVRQAISQALKLLDNDTQNVGTNFLAPKSNYSKPVEPKEKGLRQMLYVSPEISPENETQLAEARGILPTLRDFRKDGGLSLPLSRENRIGHREVDTSLSADSGNDGAEPGRRDEDKGSGARWKLNNAVNRGWVSPMNENSVELSYGETTQTPSHAGRAGSMNKVLEIPGPVPQTHIPAQSPRPNLAAPENAERILYLYGNHAGDFTQSMLNDRATPAASTNFVIPTRAQLPQMIVHPHGSQMNLAEHQMAMHVGGSCYYCNVRSTINQPPNQTCTVPGFPGLYSAEDRDDFNPVHNNFYQGNLWCHGMAYTNAVNYVTPAPPVTTPVGKTMEEASTTHNSKLNTSNVGVAYGRNAPSTRGY